MMCLCVPFVPCACPLVCTDCTCAKEPMYNWVMQLSAPQTGQAEQSTHTVYASVCDDVLKSLTLETDF